MRYLIVIWFATTALAVNTSHWTHTSEADFKKGTFKNVVVTNLGDMKLSRNVKTIMEQNPQISAVYSLAEGPDGAIYAGTGPHGIVLRIKDGKTSHVYHPDGTANVFALMFDKDGRLLIGTGGEKGAILRVANPADEKPKIEQVFVADGVSYVWAIVQTEDGNLYAATGPNGQIFEIAADGSQSVVIDSDENNILSLITDGKDTLHAGTDPNGLIYRINRKTKEMFVLYDAPETEVAALVMDGKGNLYAATAEASEQPKTVTPEAGAVEKTGRPEGGTGGVPIPSQPPENPKPPKLPDPNPGEPNPIPKAHGSTGILPVIHRPEACATNDWEKALGLADLPPNPGQPKPANPNQPNPAPVTPPTPQPVDFGTPKAEGNAIYRIDTDGFVREVFRQNVIVLSLLERDGVLLVGTGSEGLVYQVDPTAEETIVLAKVDSKQVLSMLPAKDGRTLLGLANIGSIEAMSAGFASEGTFTSPVLDATQISRFGKMHLQGSLPENTGLTIATRSGNLQDPDKSGWSNWSEETPAASFVQIKSPAARFLQYRLTFISKTHKESAVVDEVDVAYQMPNLAPVVKSIKVGGTAPAPLDAGLGAAKAAKNTTETITWDAEDGNSDGLVYSLHFRSGAKSPWVLIKEKLTEAKYEWDTRTVADGRYEIRVTASDAGANVAGQGKIGSRVSDPIVVDNTAPVIGDIKTTTEGTTAKIVAKVVDRTTTLASLDYTIDSGTDWQAVLASDNIFDGPEETVDFSVSKLTPGRHQITLRATDARGNQGFETVFVDIPK